MINLIKMSKYVLLAIVCVNVIACGNGSNGSVSPPPAPPGVTVQMLTPANNATGVSSTIAMQVRFNQSVVGVDAANVVLHAGSITGEAVPISITQEADGKNTYMITPVYSLKHLTSYYLVLGSGIIDSNGERLSPTTFSFTTTDGSILYITNFSYADGHHTAPLSSVLKCLINNDNTFTCSDSGVGNAFRLPFAIAINPSGTIAYISNSGESLPTNLGYISKCTINADGSFGQCSDSGGGNNFSSPFGIAINPISNIAYVSDFNINGITTCTLEADIFHLCNLAENMVQLNEPAGMAIENINNTTWAYVANFGNNTVSKCSIGSNDLLTNCVDSGAGAIFPSAYGVAINPKGLIAYITSHFSSQVFGCKIDPSSGDFTHCVTVVNQASLESHPFQPNLITFNKDNNEVYFTTGAAGTAPNNELIRCAIINNDYTNLSCHDAGVDPSLLCYPSGVAIKY